MRRQKTWRVRVKRSIEDWVDIQADTPLQAETLAATMPGVIFVFSQSTIRGDKPIDRVPDAGVEDDDEDY